MRFLVNLLLLLAVTSTLVAQRQGLVTNYPPEVTGSGVMVYSITADVEGILYFGTSKGVLVYDGDSWESFDLNQQGEVRSVAYDPRTQRIYVGGLSYFGYIENHRASRFRYVPLSDSIGRLHSIREVWQVLVKSDSVMFQSNEGHFIYSNEKVTFLPIKYGYVYQSGRTVYISQIGGNLFTVTGTQIDTVWNQAEMRGAAAYSILPFTKDEDLLVYPRLGAMIRNTRTGKISRYPSNFTELCKLQGVYMIMPLNDSLLAVDTWKDGVFITDRSGRKYHQFNDKSGLQASGIYDMELGQHNRLWLALDYGISFIDLKSILKDPPVAATPARVVYLEVGGGPRQYITGPNDTLSLERIPGHLELLFTQPQSEYYGQKEFRYRLEGYEDEWKVINGNMAEYRRIPTGTYVFSVQAAGVNSRAGHVVIRITSPWYAIFEGPAGYTLLALVVLAIIALLVVLRARKTRRTLRRLVLEKTSEIERTKEELIQTNRILRETNEELDTFLYRSSHDLVAPVKSIRGLIQLMRMSPQDQEQYTKMMEERILKLENLLYEINNYVRHTRQEEIISEFYPAEFDWHGLV